MSKLPYGVGLLLVAAHLALRFAGSYYQTHKGEYSAEQVIAIDALIAAAEQLEKVVQVILLP